MPPGNFAFLTPVVTPRPQNRPRKTGKLTPGKNPSTTGSAGRSDPARDACGRPRAFHLLENHTPNFSPNREKRRFLFLLPNWALWGPNRPGTGGDGSFPPPGAQTGHTGPHRRRNPALFRQEKTVLRTRGFLPDQAAGLSATQALTGRVSDWCGQQLLCILLMLSEGGKKAKNHGTLLRNHTRCRRFQACEHQISKKSPSQITPLHASIRPAP